MFDHRLTRSSLWSQSATRHSAVECTVIKVTSPWKYRAVGSSWNHANIIKYIYIQLLTTLYHLRMQMLMSINFIEIQKPYLSNEVVNIVNCFSHDFELFEGLNPRNLRDHELSQPSRGQTLKATCSSQLQEAQGAMRGPVWTHLWHRPSSARWTMAKTYRKNPVVMVSKWGFA